MRYIASTFCGLVCLGFSSGAFAKGSNSKPSFNCQSELTQIEQSICNSNRLAKLDVKLFKLYKTVGKTWRNKS